MPRHNVVVILSDEHAAEVLGVEGHRVARTPNLDRLAARGTRFTRAYTPSPICVPARAAFATGRPVHAIGYWDNANAYDGRVRGWGHVLQDHGVRVEAIGKLHYRAAEDPTGFDAEHLAMHIVNGQGMVWGLVRNPLPVFQRQAAGMLRPIGPGTSKYNLYDVAVADRAIAWLNEAPTDQPFVLFVGLVAPHFPLTVPPEWLALYPPETLPRPRLHPSTGYRRHPWVEDMHVSQPVDDSLNDEERQLALACYLGLVSYLDHQVGRILDALAASPHAQTTRIVYSSDHGDNMGTRGLWGKCVLYEESARVPLIVAGPGVPAGRVSTTPMNLTDARASLLAALDVVDEAPDPDGRDWFAAASAPDDPARLVLSEYHAVGSRTGAFLLADARYKYIHYVGHPPELFDLEQDPGETRSVADDEPYRAVRDAMAAALHQRLDPEAVSARALADQAQMIEHYGGPERALTLGAPGASPVPI
ncbi:MAG: sulfatase [Alphaproteobacteria bacterium]|nr:MAG: sulfatase [Alphaproteobacteria bacterium]